MKILFFGDSLTKGQVGACFIDLLTASYPHGRFTNRGTNGDTMNIITKKILKHLEQSNDYDFVVLQGGGNDILLPYFKARGGLFKLAYHSQLKKGLIPLATSTEYYHALVAMFQKIKRLYKGKIIFITMSCINEKLDTEPNKKRIAFNEAARKAALEEGIAVADIEPLFEQFLENKAQTDYLIESFWAVTLFDRVMSLCKRGITLLSNRRKLFLTIDGAHINNEGAAIISHSLMQIIGKKSVRKQLLSRSREGQG